MKLLWRKSRHRKGKMEEQDTFATTLPAAPKSVLNVLRLKTLFGKRKQGIYKPQDPGFIKDSQGVGNLSITSLHNRSVSIEPVTLDSCYDSLPLETGLDAVEVLESNTSLPSVKLSGLYEQFPSCEPTGSDSSCDTVIVRCKEDVFSSGASSNNTDSNARSDTTCNSRFPDVETSWTTNSIKRGMLVVSHTPDDSSHTKGGGLCCKAQECKRAKGHSSREERLLFIAANTVSKLGKQAKYADPILSSSKGRSYESFKDFTDLVEDIAGADKKDLNLQRQPKVFSFASPWRQANFSSPARRFAKDLPLYGRQVLSVGRWETVNQVPHIRPGHARVLSSTTIVNTNSSQGGTPTPQPNNLQCAELLPTRVQLEEESTNTLKKDIEDDGALIGINAISPDVKWETILDSRQTSHKNEIADLIEDHAAEIQELRDEITEQVRRVKHKLTSALSANRQLKEKNAELRERRNRQVEQLQHKDKALQQVLADHRSLQHRFEQLEMHLPQQERTEVPDPKVTNDNASLGRITALEVEVNDKGQLLRVAHDMNIGLAAALAKEKLEAEFYAEKVYELTGRLEDKPASDTEKDRLLEYKDKMYKDMDIRCSEVVEGLQSRVQDLEKETELNNSCSSGEIKALQSKLKRMTRANLDLEARKNAFKSVNISVFDMLKRPEEKTRALKSMDEINRLVHSDNDYLRRVSEAKEKEICDAEAEASWLRTAIRENREGEDRKVRTISMLEEKTRGQACELGRLQAEVEILPAQHEEALANKDIWISHYKQKAEISDQEKNTFISTRLDHWVRWTLQGKDQEISRLENEAGKLRSDSLELHRDLEKMAEVRTQDALYAHVGEQESLLNKERTRAAEEEVRILRTELSDLRQYHHPIRNEEDKDTKEVLRESEELQEAHAKVEAESREEVISLNARLEQGTIWAHAVKDLGSQLLARMSELENMLQLYGIQNNDNQRGALIDRYNSLLDFVEDNEDEADTECEGQVEAEVPGAEQILSDLDDVLARSSTDSLQGIPADKATSTDVDAGVLSAVAAGKLLEAPDNRAQRIIAENGESLRMLFDSHGRVEFGAITAPPEEEVDEDGISGQEDEDSFHISSSAWARKYPCTDEAGLSNITDESFF